MNEVVAVTDERVLLAMKLASGVGTPADAARLQDLVAGRAA